ncbi:transcriptional regulator, TetR family [Chitinophaga sp. YR627]|uniref:TetR/AcrR family transcriptional regulator n=1 Tax=Chitinophaga sp. YR627 TaxID=1881041 RepID=UPI0008F1B71C|nr:TetR/AcrR family transcriptional regulator [Chitinophaga sp. YR627]SFM91124.1 transcriptional regulator, TetR family [Chitinophaga sp. YR627]
MDTKEKILAAALKLYNSKGINTTTRHIAASMSISAGNLHYHYKHTDDIIRTLYEKLEAEFDGLMGNVQEEGEMSLATLNRSFGQSFQVLYKYRFIFLHFVEIGTRVPDIRNAYHQLVKRREAEFKALFYQLAAAGVFRKDIPDEIWSALVTQIFIVNDYWLSMNEMTDRLKGKEAAAAYQQLVNALLYPYLAKP